MSIIKFPTVTDSRGNLTYINQFEHVPFEIKRVFTLYNIPKGESRGNHAHKKLSEVVIALKGEFKLTTYNLSNGALTQYESQWMDNPSEGYLIKPNYWRVLTHFSQDCVCLVLCSEIHDESDYIREF